MKKLIIVFLVSFQWMEGIASDHSLPSHFLPVEFNGMKQDSIPFPWSGICLTCREAKVLSTVVVPGRTRFPWVPVIGGTAAAGTATYFLTRKKDEPVDCNFTASAQISGTTCERSNGSITLAVTPTGHYDYTWSNQFTGFQLVNAIAGTYSVTITQPSTNCTQIHTYTIANTNPSFNADITTQDAICGQANGSAVFNISPNDSYTYTWSNGGSTGSTQTNMEAGNYTVTVNAGAACHQTFNLTIAELPPAFEIQGTTTAANCGESNGTGNITVVPEGAYDYEWSDGSSGAHATGLATGHFSVTVTQQGTICSKTIEVIVGELPPIFEIQETTTAANCGEANGTGNVTVVPEGEYLFEWSNGLSGQQVTGLPAGNFTVTVTQQGTICSRTIEVIVGELPPLFELESTTTPSDCGLATGTATILVSPPGNYTYAWASGSSNAEAGNLSSGTYMVTVTLEGTSCSKSAQVEIGTLPANFEISLVSTASSCGQSNGSAMASILPKGNYAYAWSNGSTEALIQNLSMGLYVLTVTLVGTECSVDTTLSILELPPKFLATSIVTPSGCTDSTGTANIMVDPPGSYAFNWSNGLTGAQISGLASGEYTVTISIPGTSCSIIETINILSSGVEFTGALTTVPANCGVADGSAMIVISPDGSYSYLWSDQQTTANAQNLVAGNYSVSVTDINGCTLSYSITIAEMPPLYISILSTEAGICTGGGEINFMLTQPAALGDSPMIMDVQGPGVSISVSLPPGSYMLSNFGNILPGNYQVIVYNQSIGPGCADTSFTFVADNSPTPVPEDDFYSTPSGISVTGNVLDNDAGIHPEVTSVSNINGGEVTFSPDGNFTFIPEPGFIGLASFIYEVTDECGISATAQVFIMVTEVICDFNLDVNTQPASCGLADGSITVEVIEPGMYSYQWEAGVTGPVISNIASDVYVVFVTDINSGCTLEFAIEVPEIAADYIDEVEIIQPICGEMGEISFLATPPGNNQLIMTIDNPNGIHIFLIEEGPVFVSDYIPIVSGHYIIEVMVEGAGPDCIESFEVDILVSPAVEIIVEAVFPPTTPSGMDGAIVIVVLSGMPPYMVLVNGVTVFTTSDNSFIIPGLGVGNYTVQVIDGSGCASNVLNVFVPLPDIVFEFGSGITSYQSIAEDPEKASADISDQAGMAFITSMHYFLGNKTQEIQCALLTLHHNRNDPGAKSHYISLAYLSEFISTKWKPIHLDFQGGFGVQLISANSNFLSNPAQHWMLRANIHHHAGKYIHLHLSATLMGWNKIDYPLIQASLGIQFPQARTTKSPSGF